MEEIVEKFEKFIREEYYDDLIKVIQNYPEQSSLVIDFKDLDKFNTELADLLLDDPDKTIPLVREAASKIFIPSSKDIKVNYRFKNIPKSREIRIRDLRSKHISKLIAVDGIVRVRGEVRPEITKVLFECPGCGKEIEVKQGGGNLKTPNECACGRTRNFRLKKRLFSDTQRLLIEEPAEVLIGGEAPSDIYVKLSEDLANPKAQSKVIPGNKVRIIGITRELPRRKGSLKYDIYIEANYVEPRELEWEELKITDEDIKRIKKLAKSKEVHDKLIKSIAPSIYGYENLKEAIALQLFGAPAKKMPDGSRIRGDIHIITIGDPATGKCVTGDSKILTASGEEREIKEIVQEALSRNEVYEYDGVYCIDNHDILTLNPDAKVTEGKAIVFWKRKAPKNLYKIVTRTGREITVTPSHPFFVYDGVNIVGKAASEIQEGEFVAVPNQIPIKGKPQRIDMEIKRTPAPNGIHIKVPKKTSTELCGFIGYLLGEGYSRYTSTSVIISITNSSPVILKDFEECAKLFEVPVHKREGWYYITSIELGRFLTKLEPSLLKGAKYKKIPKIIFKCPKKEIAALIRAYFDSDASVDQRKRLIEVTSASKELLEGIRSLLLRFGILSQLHSRKVRATNSKMKHKNYYRLTISGEDAIKYNEEIGFLHEFKKKRLETAVGKGKIHTNLNLIPNLSEILKFLRERLRMTQFDFMVPRTTYQHYERGDRKPTREELRLLIKSFWKRLDEIEKLEGEIEKSDWKGLREIREKLNLSQADMGNLAGMSGGNVGCYERGEYGGDLKPRKKDIKRATNELKDVLKSFCERLLNNKEVLTRLEKLRLLANSDIFWDQISSIKKIRSKEKWVYDLQVDNTHNFVANNMFVNNTKLLEYVSKLVPRSRYVSGKGVSGVGLCVAPDTFVHLSDGSIDKIEDFVERRFKNSEPEKVKDGVFRVRNEDGTKISALSDSLKVKDEEIDYFWKIKSPNKWTEIKTRNGKSLRVTPGTKLLLLNENDPKWREADKLKVKDKIATVGSEIFWDEIKEVEEISPESEWTYDLTTKNSHNFIANGLVVHNTATVRREEKFMGGWVLEAGALVLTNKSILCVDEFGQISKEDQIAMNQALSIQSISVAKASIVATLPSQTAVLAGANPKLGRFDPYTPIADQVTVPPTLLSRFDLKFIMRDIPSPEQDSKMAEHMLNAQMGKMEAAKPALDPGFVRKYVAYARQNCNPKLTKRAGDKLKEYYISLREKHAKEEIPTIPLTPRQYEALIRLATASARIRLDTKVRIEDAERAISLLQTSLRQLGISPETGEVDIDIIETGIPSAQRSKMFRILEAIKELEETVGKSIPVDDVVVKAKEKGIEEADAEQIIQKLKKKGEIFEPKPGFIRKI